MTYTEPFHPGTRLNTDPEKIYPAILAYIALYHRYEITTGFKNLIRSFRRKRDDDGLGHYQDVHMRLMSEYPEGERRQPVIIPGIANEWMPSSQSPNGGISCAFWPR